MNAFNGYYTRKNIDEEGNIELVFTLKNFADIEIAKELEEAWKADMYFSNTYPEMHAALTAAGIKGYNTVERGFVDICGFYK